MGGPGPRVHPGTGLIQERESPPRVFLVLDAVQDDGFIPA